MFSFLARKKKDPQKELKRVLGDYDLPKFSAAAMKTLEAIREPHATPKTIGAALRLDPQLSVRVLSVSNSAAYALPRQVESVEQAVALLGRTTLESLVLTAATGQALPRPACPGFDSRRFWRAAACRASTARVLAERFDPANASLSFTAAILQDMAVPLIAQEKPAEYGRILEHWHTSDDDLAALEQSEFGWNHAEVATWICDAWGLPESLAAPIGAHHGVHGEGNEGLDCPLAVSLVSHIKDSDDAGPSEQLIEAMRERLSLHADQAVELLEESFASAAELADLLG